MVSKTHSRQDVYVNGTLAYLNATVVEAKGILRVRAKVADRPGVFSRVIDLSDVVKLADQPADTGTARSWTGKTSDGETLEVTAIPRKGCVPCGKR